IGPKGSPLFHALRPAETVELHLADAAAKVESLSKDPVDGPKHGRRIQIVDLGDETIRQDAIELALYAREEIVGEVLKRLNAPDSVDHTITDRKRCRIRAEQ